MSPAEQALGCRAVRAALVLPADNARMIEKARALAVDEVVLDLEDAVAPDRKEAARRNIADAVETLAADHRVAVRINAIGTEWAQRDLEAVAACSLSPHTVVVPKVEKPADLVVCREALVELPDLRLQALIETAAAVENLAAIAATNCGLHALILGYVDLAASMGRPDAALEDPSLWAAVQDCVVVAARAHGLQAIDGPYLRLGETESLEAWCHLARLRGFDGKWSIHPDQVEPITAAFTPDAAEVARARSVIAALDDAEEAGSGSIRHDGGMVDEAVRKSALMILARAGEGQ